VVLLITNNLNTYSMSTLNTVTTVVLSRKELADKINKYILDTIDAAGYEDVVLTDDKSKVNFVMSEFEAIANYPDNIKRLPNEIDRFADWLAGLPSIINIDFENYRIIEIAKEWGSLSSNPTSGQQNKIIGNWFNYISNKFFQLHKKLNK